MKCMKIVRWFAIPMSALMISVLPGGDAFPSSTPDQGLSDEEFQDGTEPSEIAQPSDVPPSEATPPADDRNAYLDNNAPGRYFDGTVYYYGPGWWYGPYGWFYEPGWWYPPFAWFELGFFDGGRHFRHFDRSRHHAWRTPGGSVGSGPRSGLRSTVRPGVRSGFGGAGRVWSTRQPGGTTRGRWGGSGGMNRGGWGDSGGRGGFGGRR